MRHSTVAVVDFRRRESFFKFQRLFAAHPINEHRTLMERKVVLVARVELSAKCNFIFAGSGNRDAVLLAIDYYLSAIVTRPRILESK